MATQDIAGAAESGTYARVEIGTLHLAVNSRHVVQAIPRPAQLTLLPRGKGALAGVFSHRGQVVPLVSLDRWLHDAEGADSDGAQGAALVTAATSVCASLIARLPVDRSFEPESPMPSRPPLSVCDSRGVTCQTLTGTTLPCPPW